MRRVKIKVSDTEAQARLEAYRAKVGAGPHSAASLAVIIWPGEEFIAPQGAGAAASRVLKRLGCRWESLRNPLRWGWVLDFPVSEKRG